MSSDGNRVDDGSAILGTIGNEALSKCSVVEREDDEENEFPDAEPEDEEDVHPEDESDSEGDSALEDKDEASELRFDVIARLATRSLPGCGLSLQQSPRPSQSETSVDTCVEAASRPSPDVCNPNRWCHAALDNCSVTVPKLLQWRTKRKTFKHFTRNGSL